MKTKRKSAILAGIALIIMAVTAIFTFGYAHNSLVVHENPEITFNNLTSNILLFKLEIAGWLFFLLLDVIVALALYFYFKKENEKLANVMAGLRVIFVVIFAIAISNLFSVFGKLNDGLTENYTAASKQIMGYFHDFELTWSFALIIFGIHLFSLGILALQSKLIHNIWGVLLVFAAISYIVIHTAKFLFPEHENLVKTVEMILSLPMAFGEVGFAIWLIIRGGKPKKVYDSKKAVLVRPIKVLSHENKILGVTGKIISI